MFLEEMKKKHDELILITLENHDYDLNTRFYSNMFDACLLIAENICQAESEEYINEFKLNIVASIYFMRRLCEIIDKEKISNTLSITDAVGNGSAVRQALENTKEYFENEGLFEVLGSSKFHTTFKEVFA